MENSSIISALEDYANLFPAEANEVERLKIYLGHVSDPFDRKEFLGHITCSAVVINSKSNVLLVHHNSLGTWLTPGGHVEMGDASLVGAALREVEEETGLTRRDLRPASATERGIPFDIDHHSIPESIAKSEPSHFHWDFRFLFHSDSQLLTAQASEVGDARWMPVDFLTARLQQKLSSRSI
jgi:8-oxo-dGTP pyrophosphatase MutT (NUDIX family)